MTIDPFSDVLRSVRLSGALFIEAQFSAPWSVAAKVNRADCIGFQTPPTQMIAYHVILEGSLLLCIEGETPVAVRAGEIVLLPRNDDHVMASETGLAPIQASELLQVSADGGLARIVHGKGGAATHIVCGYLASDGGYNPLIAGLPKALTLDVREGTSRDWIEASVRFAANELAAGRLASSSVMSRLSETLLVEAVRNYASTLTDAETSWLKGLKDPYVGRALSLIHQNIGAPWTNDGLAREVALSRSAFVERFSALVGMPPIRYVTTWRLQTAKLQLREATASIGQLAYSVGYDSEEAFSRAFKREFGVTPGRWRSAAAGN